MAREIELEKLTKDVILEITNTIKLSKAVIIVLDNNEVFYEANATSNNHRTISRAELETIGEGVVISDALESGIVKEVFSKYDLDVCVDLRSTNELNGYLLLGNKKSGDIFNQTDIKTLNILSHELAIALHNAKSYTQIQNFNKTLQKRIDEATAQLRDANEHLKELDQLKNEFLSMATHQLNTPLTVVDGYLTLINDGVVSEPAERKDYLDKTLGRVRAMKRMVSDFLNISRIETGKFIIDVKPTDINKMVSEEVNGLGPSAKEKEVFLHFIPPKHPVPMVEIDEQKTRQAVMNLIDNAIYYTPKGEVKVYLDTDKEFVAFKVVDNGIGVPEKQKDKLFQKFYRADNAKLERPNGNGVGLFLVKRVAEDQGGKIIFESEQGKGSTFGFTLPIKSKLKIEPKTPEPQPKEAVPA
jgi:signal transduction histidine kinase